MQPTRAIALAAALAIGLAACSSPSSTAPTAPAATPGGTAASAAAAQTVELRNFAFSPATLTVPAGTTVTFRNDDAAKHDVVNGKDGRKAADARFDVQIDPGSVGTVTFDTAGTFDVTCTIHPTMNMTVTVQ